MADESAATLAPAEHFEDMTQQQYAARLGMWVFLGSETLLFMGLFVLYVAYRAEFPRGFGEAIAHNTLVLGTINTMVLLGSSYSVASSLHALRNGRRGLSLTLLALTIVLGATFVVIKVVEYRKHFAEGIYPGGVGHFFTEHTSPGAIQFFTLYFVTTGLHAAHVIVGMLILSFMAYQIVTRVITPEVPHRLELGAIYWHLVDVIWIFLWPIYYLIPGSVES
jgi:cytochrome c oxidase subunit 3